MRRSLEGPRRPNPWSTCLATEAYFCMDSWSRHQTGVKVGDGPARASHHRLSGEPFQTVI